MNDRAVGLLEQYDMDVLKTKKGRGAIICDTSLGCLIFKEYKGNAQKIAAQNSLLTAVRERGTVCVESIVPNKEGKLTVQDSDGTSYVLKTWVEGRECNIYDRGECLQAVRVLALLHKELESCLSVEEVRGEMDQQDSSEDSPIRPLLTMPVTVPGAEYEKHNRELKKVRKFLRERGQKSWFEICLQQAFDYFLEQAEEVTGQWQEYRHLSEGQPECGCFCHGDYQYHNIVNDNGNWHIINFERIVRDNPIRDLYLLLRKLLEKSNWSVALGTELLAAYQEVRPISAYSQIDLYYRLSYPEKFWKIVNFYYNSRKSWIPERNLEKLTKLQNQEAQKQVFLETVFREVGNSK